MTELTTPEEVQEFIEQNSIAVIFKSGQCRQTDEAIRRLKPFFNKYPDVPVALIEVVEHRKASVKATDLAGKKHESPQLLLFKDGKCIYDANHWRIEGVALIDVVATHKHETKND